MSSFPIGTARRAAVGRTLLGGWSLTSSTHSGRAHFVVKERYRSLSRRVRRSPTSGVSFHEKRRLQRAALPLLLDGDVVGEADIPTTTPCVSISGAGLTRWEQGHPIGAGYDAPFRFTGTLRRSSV